MIKKLQKHSKYLRPAVILVILVVFISTLLFVLYRPKTYAQIFLTTGTSWTVPNDWNNTNNTIEVIGGGGGGAGGVSDSSGSGGGGGGGGGAGGYAKITNVTLVPGSTVAIAIGGGGSGSAGAAIPSSATSGSDTYLCNSTSNCTSITDSAVVVGAKGGNGGAPGTSSTGGTGGTGGAGTSGIGSTKFSGGTGGSPTGPASAAGSGGGGGGGAGGLNNNGNNGNANTGTTTGGTGGQGDGTAGGAGGTGNGGTGGNGTEYQSSPDFGSGGGGAGGNGIANGSGSPGGNGGTYGSGGGGGGGNGSKHGTGGNGGNGIQGLIRITYSFVTQADYRFRSDDGNETTGTSLASQDTQASIVGTTPVRLRFLVTNTGDTTTDTYRLEYAPYNFGCVSWTAVPGAGSVTTQAFNMYNTTNYTDQAASTNVSTGPAVITDPLGFTFTAGVLVSNNSNTATVTLNSGQFTEIEYAFQANSNATNPSYCFRLTNNGTALDSYSNYPILNINYPPSAPTIYSVNNGSTNATRLPVWQLQSSDYNNDYLQYQVEVCSINSWPCTTSDAQTYTTSDSCWSGYNANGDTAYSAGTNVNDSQLGVCTTPIANLLQPNTTYYMRAKAIDPGGSNTFGAYSSTVTFTTGNLNIRITGGASITGGTKIGN